MPTTAKKSKTKVSRKPLEKPAQAEKKYFQGIGRRKLSVARARVFMSSGKKSAKDLELIINKKPYKDYFSLTELKEIAISPLKVIDVAEISKVSVMVRGGGIRGQAEATRLAIARAIVLFDQKFKKPLRDLNYLTRDSRVAERKKPGLKKARRAPQFSKR